MRQKVGASERLPYPWRRQMKVKCPLIRDRLMHRTLLPSTSVGQPSNGTRRIGVCIALLPVLDVVLALMDEAIPQNVGGFSFFQIYRVAITLGMILIVCAKPVSHMRDSRSVNRLFFAALACFAVFSVKEYVETSALSTLSLAAYTRIAYWLVLWRLVTALPPDSTTDRILIAGIIVTACIMACAVYGSLLTGSNRIYQEEAELAVSGGFRSGKTVAGPVLVGSVLTLYSAYMTKRIVMTIVTVLCWGAVLMTYNRTGMVCIVACVLWLGAWTVLFGRANRRWVRGATLVVMLLAIGVAAIILSGRYEGFVNRWDDVSLDSGDAAGSGRAGLWLTAIDWFRDTDPLDQAFGIGYVGMFRQNYIRLGNPMIHAHSDIFDLLYMGGLLGIGLWACILMTCLRVCRDGVKAQYRSVEFAMLGCLYLILLTYSVLTSAFYGPLLMSCIIIGIVTLIRSHTARLLASSEQNREVRGT